MKHLSNIQNTQISAGLASLSGAPGGGMQITVTDTSTMNINGLVFTANTVSINGVAHPEAFTSSGFVNGANTIFGTTIETGSVYIVR